MSYMHTNCFAYHKINRQRSIIIITLQLINIKQIMCHRTHYHHVVLLQEGVKFPLEELVLNEHGRLK